MIEEKGILFVLSGPSGVGKGTVRKELFQHDTALRYSISMTTREKRQGETDGVDYFYKTNEEFESLIAQNKLLEYAKYVNNYYGTPRDYVEKTLAEGHDVFLEIEVQGALQVKENFPEGVFIFLFPPSLEELKNRIVNRGTETEELVLNRLKAARDEIEMMDAYDYVVVNDQIKHAVAKVKSIIQSEHCKRERIAKQYKQLLEDDIK
ncbi:guanylate kinase [Virgibacillus dakarensis]|uniref:Guanylate kinase n=1 Tax=Lentibacillus populi TaxID=1827502 RepID=A0A9W5TU36_9BACI|nr:MULTISPECIES: guanylate kinase [Bacillaceae]MBT2216896.1 guanylate kinase [Virgibacillus dakarensis]MTW85302.1 guanylate kinase [Virgibacillus dakarensis]GGB29691.1 guanylate kinase [Lentibacillus populi]